MKKAVLIVLSALLVCVSAISLQACARDARGVEGESRATYKLDVAVREGLDDAYLTEEVIFTNSGSETIEELVFCLYPNAYRKDAENSAYFDNMANTISEFGGIDIGSVKVNGAESAFVTEEIWLEVPLTEKLEPDDTVTVRLGARIDIAGGTLRFGGDGKTVRLLNFYPVLAYYGESGWERSAYSRIGDPFHTASATYEVKISAPDNVSIATSGAQTSLVEENGVRTVEATAADARDFAAVLSTEYSLAETASGDVKIKYYSSGADKAEFVAKATDIFTEYFGEFPYPEFSVCESPFYYGGMEYPGLVVINSALSDAEKEEVIVHELVHQWIGCAVGSDGVHEGWVDESLTTFLAAYYYKLAGDESRFISEVKDCDRQYAAFLLTEKLNSPGYVPSIARNVYEFSTLYEYDAVVYRRGCGMYASLMELAGEKKLREAITSYYERYKFADASGEELIECFDDVLGGKARAVMYSYLNADVRTGNIGV